MLNRAGSRIYAEDTTQGLPKGVTGAYTLKQHAQNASKGEANPCHEPQRRAGAGGARRVVVGSLLAARAPGRWLCSLRKQGPGSLHES